MNKTGIIVNIYKASHGACDGTANFSSKHDKCILIASPDFPNVSGPFAPDAEKPAVAIVKRTLFGNKEPYLTAYPVVNGKIDSSRRMFGGCYIETSDSRFPAVYPVPLHDRTE